jgi:hypothetical protein
MSGMMTFTELSSVPSDSWCRSLISYGWRVAAYLARSLSPATRGGRHT